MTRPRTAATPAALAALMAAALFASLTAASAAEPCATTVYYRLHDLATDRGARALYWRIVDAAKLVCPPEDPRKLWLLAQSSECQRQAIARTIAKIGSPRLAALYAHMRAQHG
ncbi:MAG TPA: UrcA family protein [Steroidobacteraceae bacterium]|nr:UrcA family protein [Steroidobacteraceae bacterium]